MKIFDNYSAYYDLLYKDKDYTTEANYIHERIQHYLPGAKTILSLGCGTGNYEFLLEKFGYEITGIDISPEMISLADEKRKMAQSSTISFEVADIKTYKTDKRFDVVISLFHVISYQIS